MTKKIPNDLSIAKAKWFAYNYPISFITHWGFTFHGFTFKPACSYCESRKVKRLKGPCEIKGKTYGFVCVECKKPTELTAVPE